MATRSPASAESNRRAASSTAIRLTNKAVQLNDTYRLYVIWGPLEKPDRTTPKLAQTSRARQKGIVAARFFDVLAAAIEQTARKRRKPYAKAFSDLLIGPNNAGKTNLCSALRFLGLTALGPLENAAKSALGETWNICNVYQTEKIIELEVEATLSDEGEQLEFDYLLRVTAEQDPASLRQSLRVSEEVLKLTGGKFKQTPLLENHSGQAKLLHEKRFLGEVSGWDKYVETLSPQEATMLSRLFDLDTNRRANLFKRYLQAWFYYNLYPMPSAAPRSWWSEP